MRRQRRQRWFDPDNPNRVRTPSQAPSGGLRYLISLIALLVVVVLLIRQTSDPKNVERVSHAIGLISKDRAANPETQERPSSVPPADVPVEETPTKPNSLYTTIAIGIVGVTWLAWRVYRGTRSR